MRLTSSHVYLLDPLNIMCSRKCETPLIDGSSSREPVFTNRPRAVEWESGFTSAMTSRPLGSCLWWNVRGIGGNPCWSMEPALHAVVVCHFDLRAALPMTSLKEVGTTSLFSTVGSA